MSRQLLAILALVAAVSPGMVHEACAQTVPLFSLDIGSDWDLSDPIPNSIFPLPNRNPMWDAGDIQLVSKQYNIYPTLPRPIDENLTLDPNNQVMLYKNDDGPVAEAWNGFPFPTGFGAAGQPVPSAIGPNSYTNDADVQAKYMEVFDLDAEDQIAFEFFGDNGLILLQQRGWQREPKIQQSTGIYFESDYCYVSYEDDGPAGWYISGHVPTVSGPDHDTEIYVAPLMGPPGPTLSWALETNLGLEPNPNIPPHNLETNYDDDVDALDLHPDFEPEIDAPDFIYQNRYWSPDHEANATLDPGSIYLTRNDGTTNLTLAFDQVLHLGLPAHPSPNNDNIMLDPDVDAFEFLAISPETYERIFGQPAGVPEDILVGLFSVDSDDPDTLLTDESGLLNPNAIYISDLTGQFRELMVMDEDVDALAVIPEPASLVLVLTGVLGLIVFCRRRKR